MGNWQKQKLKTLRVGFQRYYVLRQLHGSKSTKVALVLHFCSTLQILTLLLPLRDNSGYPWNYEVFWPVWYCLNAVGRPDRILETVASADIVVYLYAAGVAARAGSLAAWIGFLGSRRKVEFWTLAKKNRMGCLGTYLRKVDSFTLFVMSRLVSLPCVSFFSATIVVPPDGVSLAVRLLSAALLPLEIVIVLTDRLQTADLLWQSQNEGPAVPLSAFLLSLCDLSACVAVALYSFLNHDVILRAVVFIIGGCKAVYTYRQLPFHTRTRNIVESFQGSILLWVVILLTLSLNAGESSSAPALLLLLGLPLLLFIDCHFIDALEEKMKTGPIGSEAQHAKAFQEAFFHPTKPEENEDSLKQHPQLGAIWLHQMQVYPLLWTAYYFLRNGESYFAKVAIALIGGQERTLANGVAVEVCITRALLQLEQDDNEMALQNFLSMNHLKERIQVWDYEATVLLRNFYQSLVRKTTAFSHLVLLTQRMSVHLQRTVGLYHRSIEIFPKKVSLLEAYSGFLAMVGRQTDAQRYANMVEKLLQRKRKRTASGIDRLVLEDPKCVIFVVPMSGPQVGQIVWAVNSEAIGYTDDNIRGLDHNILIPEMFKASHVAMEENLVKKRAVPNVLLNAYKMFIVNKDKELLFGTWKVFGVNEADTGHLIIVASIRLEPPPKEFGILGQYGGVMECTKGFATFVKETKFLQECNMHSKDIVWKGSWNNTQLLVSKDEWNVANHQRVPCVSLFRMRSRGAAYGTIGRAHLSPDARSIQFSSATESTQMFLSRTSRGLNIDTGKTVLLGSGEIGYSGEMLISMRLHRKQTQLSKYQRLLMFTMFCTFLCGSAVTMAVGQSFSAHVVEVNRMISSITSIGMRTQALRIAIRSKELFLLSTGFSLYGDETVAREDLERAAAQYIEMRMSLKGNITSARGKFREVLLAPITPIWRYEGDSFHLYKVSLLDLMEEISRRALSLANRPLSQITADDDDFMTLYRNGASEALVAFNRSVAAFAEEKTLEGKQRLHILELLAVLSPLLCLGVSLVIVSPLLCLIERWRRRLWKNILAIPKAAVAETLELVHTRLANVHHDESGESSVAVTYRSKGQLEYEVSKSMKMMVFIALLYSVSVSISGLALHYYGKSEMETILLFKPKYVDWHSMRRAIAAKGWFHMREAWLPANVSYFSIVREKQPLYNHLEEWERANTQLLMLHHCIAYGCKYEDMNRILPTNAHRDLLYGRDSSVNDTELHAGLAPLIYELVELSSSTRRDLRAGANSDYSQGRKIEKYTTLLLPSVTRSNEQMDEDTKAQMMASLSHLTQLCTATVCVSFAALLILVFPTVRTVRVSQIHNSFQRELDALAHFPKSALLPIAGQL